MKSIFLSDSDKEDVVEFDKQHEGLYAKLVQNSKKNLGRSVNGKNLQLPGIYLSALSRSGSRLNIPDMASSFT